MSIGLLQVRKKSSTWKRILLIFQIIYKNISFRLHNIHTFFSKPQCRQFLQISSVYPSRPPPPTCVSFACSSSVAYDTFYLSVWSGAEVDTVDDDANHDDSFSLALRLIGFPNPEYFHGPQVAEELMCTMRVFPEYCFFLFRLCAVCCFWKFPRRKYVRDPSILPKSKGCNNDFQKFRWIHIRLGILSRKNIKKRYYISHVIMVFVFYIHYTPVYRFERLE